jgi:hypothetical protein
MYFSPDIFSLFGNGLTKSMAQILNSKLGFTECKGISFFHYGRPILWHLSHFFIYSQQSLCKFGHQRLDWRIFMAIVSAWKWPPTGPACVSLIMSSCSCSNAHLHKILSIPSLQRYQFMRVNVAAFISRIFLLLVGISSGAFPSSRKFSISSSSLGDDLTLNKFAYGNSSFIPVRSSPISSQDRWSGPTFFFPSRTTTLNSNSWNSSSHQHIFP